MIYLDKDSLEIRFLVHENAGKNRLLKGRLGFQIMAKVTTYLQV